jgi:hypothetical protein
MDSKYDFCGIISEDAALSIHARSCLELCALYMCPGDDATRNAVCIIWIVIIGMFMMVVAFTSVVCC